VTPEQTAFFTGPVGATGQDARVSQQAGKIIFTTTRPLRQGEGLTIAVKLAKDAIAAPTASQQQMWFIEDNLDIIIAGGGLILVFAYYLRSWFAVGRDPPRGVMVPRWDPPDGISPALVTDAVTKTFFGQQGIPTDSLSKFAWGSQKIAPQNPPSPKTPIASTALTAMHSAIMTGSTSLDKAISDAGAQFKNQAG